MTIFVLKVKAKLEGVEKLIFPADHEWVLDVLQSGGTEERKGITISSTDEYELQGSRGTANYVMKWKDSKAQSSMSLYTPTRRGPLQGETLGEYTASQSEQFVAVAAFECRGLQPIGWTPSVGYVVENEKGGKHQNVDLSARDWCEYDEERELMVGVYDLEFIIDQA